MSTRPTNPGRIWQQLAIAAVCLGWALVLPSWAWAQNSVVVHGGRFQPSADSVTVGISLSNAVTLSALSLPLEMRELTADAFVTRLSMRFANRLAGNLRLPDNPHTDQFASPIGACYQAADYSDGAWHPVAVSPEGAWFYREGDNLDEYLAPGADTVPSIVLDLDLSATPGSFVVDTACLIPGAPNRFLHFLDDGGLLVPVSFTGDTIEIQGAPVARDTSIVVIVGDAVSGMLPASDVNVTDVLQFLVSDPPTLGTADIDISGAYSYIAPPAPGTDTLGYWVSDGDASDLGVVEFQIIPPPPETVYVSTAGNDSTGDGTAGNPFRTIPHAILGTNDGDIILVAPGTYGGPQEGAVIYPGGRALTIKSLDGPFVTTLIGPGDGSGSVVVMDLHSGAHPVVLDGFTIADNTVTAEGCEHCAGGVFVGNQTNGTIINCIIRNNVGRNLTGGIEYNGAGGMIANNWIIGNYGGATPSSVGGVAVFPDADVAIVNNTISGNLGPGPDGVAGVLIHEGSSISRFDNNIVSFNTPGRGLVSVSVLPGSESTKNNLYFGNGGSSIGFGATSTWIFEDPLYVDGPTADLHLTCLSPARRAGEAASVPAGLTRDIDRQFRVTVALEVDIGADQFYDADKQAMFTPSVDAGCAPLVVDFTNQSLCIDEQWRWNFGDGQTSTLKNPSVTYQTPGLYEVRLIALGQLDADTTYDTIRVDAPLTPDFTSNVQAGCVPFQVTFTAAANSGVDSYSWDFGDGEAGVGAQVTHTYADTGLHTVRLDAVNSCGAASQTKTGYIHARALPVVGIASSFDSVTGPVCNPAAIRFYYTSDRPILGWDWDFGDNSTSNDSTPVHTYVEGDTFSVRLIATGECGNVQVVRTGYIKLTTRPKATAAASPAFVCGSGAPVTCAGAVTGNYISAGWVFGDGGTAAGLVAQHTYAQLGRYLPKLVLHSVCGIDTIPVADSITVGTTPVAAFTVDADSGYEPLSVRFADQSTGQPSSWLWRFGDQVTATTQNPTHPYTAGVYQAALEASNTCGTDTSTLRRIVVGSFRPRIVDSLGVNADTILYSVAVDSLVLPYDHTVSLSARLTPLPVRGSMTFVVTPASGTPPFNAVLKARPSPDLASGNYTIELRAVDSARLNLQGQPVAKTATRPYTYVGITSIQVTPSPIAMDSTIVTFFTTRTVTVRNTSSGPQGINLIVQPAEVSGPPFEIVPGQGNGATLAPGAQVTWTLGFRPGRKGDFSGFLRVRSNDPGTPVLQVPMNGRGIGEQVPPRVTAAVPAQAGEALIDQSVVLTFSEPMVIVPIGPVVDVRSRRADAVVAGQGQMTPLSLTFAPAAWFWPDDTITFRLRAQVTDTNGNRLDGNADGSEAGSPDDDYLLTFYTGPGVFPGDANHDGAVNEGDLLPLGRFWRTQGPPRTRPYTDFSVQPARAFPVRAAAHADCDGNGIVDSADICPIAEFFDRDTVLPKVAVEQWLAEAGTWSSSVVDALLGALVDCGGSGQGAAILRDVLERMQGQTPIPSGYALDQNYPNPFNPATVIAFSLAQTGPVRLDVYDILGRRVATLAEGDWPAGHHRVVWDGRDEDGIERASGVYFYRLQADGFQQSRKMLLLK
ncbi:MAG TPA: PKD domain-containing protein [bacterium]|nr:PKD domain-containing protein [bacterium]